ncbi:MAG: VTT domain-containing protein [Candidatus Nanoarchaeia archaeon]|nr:VTT domain-containing protein [Candidatus Nanoarchaeia archaeon]MDD5741232.1 VTT domain-containing protein [Candidatus Nanoarchaeia archaeon]
MERKHKIFWVIFILIIIPLIIFVSIYSTQVRSFIQKNISIYGYPAVLIFSILANSFDQPIGPDAIAVVGLLFGLDVLYLFIFAVIGTWIMDLTSFYIGRKVFSGKIKAACSTKKHAQHCKLFFKYGRFALLIGALTPVPEVFMIWLSGAFGMKLRDFFIYGMLAKAFRIGFVLLIAAGILSL